MSTDEEASDSSEEITRQHFISKLLRHSETGELYDCTIRASSAFSSTYKDFQCHKLILSLSSDMFKTMFSSNFKEAKMRPDEPIVLQNVEPEVFACVMRYMYGQEKDFKDISFGAEVYKLAHELHIKSLIQDVDKFFKASIKKPSEVFAIFDLYLALDGNQKTIKSCRQTLRKETAVALASEQWLNVSVEAVQEFLQMEHMFVKEVDLVKALIRWGKHQVQKDGDDPTDGQKLRVKIFPALKHIRFVGLTHIEFADLCLEELGVVLNVEERNAVLMALVTKKWNLMPSGICPPEAATPRKKPYAVCQLAYRSNNEDNLFDRSLEAYIGFKIDKNAQFIGLKFNTALDRVYETFSFELLDYDAQVIIGKGSSKDKITAEDEEFVQVNPSCVLSAGSHYTLKFTVTVSKLKGRRGFYSTFSLLSNQPAATSNGLTLKITNNDDEFAACLEKMLFLMSSIH